MVFDRFLLSFNSLHLPLFGILPDNKQNIYNGFDILIFSWLLQADHCNNKLNSYLMLQNSSFELKLWKHRFR